MEGASSHSHSQAQSQSASYTQPPDSHTPRGKISQSEPQIHTEEYNLYPESHTLSDDSLQSPESPESGLAEQEPEPLEWWQCWEEEQDTLDMESSSHITWASTEEMKHYAQAFPEIDLNRKVREKGYPNRWGARIPIHNQWNIELLENLLQDYHDNDIIEWMKYGWPIGRLPTLPDPQLTFKNHKGATQYPQALQKYITKESSHKAIIGPFTSIPFKDKVGISPLSTRPKKDSDDRRIILDLSFPPTQSVNDGIAKDNYLGFSAKLTFPKTDQFALRIYQLGQGALMFKIDLHRYFRQLNLDPGDYSMIGYIVEGKLYFDKVVPMGVRSGPYIAQRITNAITWIMQQVEHFALNYVDDFVGADIQVRAWEAFQFLSKLLRDLRIQTSPEKVVEPTTRLEFLGTTFDSNTMTIEVPHNKLKEILAELGLWATKDTATRQEIESLIGKLQFAARCVKSGRIFLARLLNWLRTTNRKDSYPVTQEARLDILWWTTFMKQYNGTSIIWLHQEPHPDQLMATDANLTGYGGISGQEFFKGTFPEHLKGKNIATLEMWAVYIALQTWKHKFTGRYFWIHVDNEAVATVLNTGRSRCTELQYLLRQIAYIAASNQFIIKAKHIMGVTNRVPDWLSRWGEAQARRNFRAMAREKSLKQIHISQHMFKQSYTW